MEREEDGKCHLVQSALEGPDRDAGLGVGLHCDVNAVIVRKGEGSLQKQQWR